jgi:DNA-binding transcriptional LysR family regulator
MAKGIDWEAQIGRRLRLRDLHAFFTVVHSGSMHKAARQLGVSQPAISKVIADLEHLLGVRLLDRSRRGVDATIYGRTLLKHGLVAFDELKQSVRNIEFLADPAAGDLKIGAPESIAATVLPKIVQLFSEKSPRVVLYVDNVPSPAFKDRGLHDRKHDLVLARLRTPLPDDHLVDDLNAEYLFDDPLVAAAGTQSRWTRRRKIDLAELIDEPWILAPPHTWNYLGLAEAFHARGLDMPRSSLVTFSMHLVGHFLANGPFITTSPRSWVHHNSLKVLPIDLPARPWPVVILTLKNRTLSPVVERFIECAREVTKSAAVGPSSRTAHGPRPRIS